MDTSTCLVCGEFFKKIRSIQRVQSYLSAKLAGIFLEKKLSTNVYLTGIF